MWYVKWRPFCLGLNLLNWDIPEEYVQYHGCWCPGFMDYEIINSRDNDFVCVNESHVFYVGGF